MQTELKPCPFCGGKPVFHTEISPFFVECDEKGCDVYGPTGKTPAEAIELWNRRALESASRPGIDALATAMHHAAIKYASGDFVDFQHEAREFLLASQPGSGEAWQAIETAPKWKEVLVWRADSGPFIAKLVAPEDVPEAEAESWEDPSIPLWLSDAYGWQEGSETPTHWMPMPAAPSAGNGEAKGDGNG